MRASKGNIGLFTFQTLRALITIHRKYFRIIECLWKSDTLFMRKRHVVFPKTTRRFIENNSSVEEKQAIRQTSGNGDWKIQDHRPMAKSR